MQNRHFNRNDREMIRYQISVFFKKCIGKKAATVFHVNRFCLPDTLT